MASAPIPEPKPGLVIGYDYLWIHEASRRQDRRHAVQAPDRADGALVSLHIFLRSSGGLGGNGAGT